MQHRLEVLLNIRCGQAFFTHQQLAGLAAHGVYHEFMQHSGYLRQWLTCSGPVPALVSQCSTECTQIETRALIVR
ncbi:hypothetical protein NBRC116187_33580 [Halopseudomonas sabulinigri]|uniref:Uncharacterized protein n=1 Tax=Halopseudomonas sabulinigri TaxID=472181 RepID=A0ABP9ZU56_9GAMM